MDKEYAPWEMTIGHLPRCILFKNAHKIKELHYKGSNVVYTKRRNGSYVEPLSTN